MAVTRGSDGAFYGVTDASAGTVFKLVTAQ
jgi:hypothetical protein